MSGRLSAYAALGLRPGADRAQIDQAYRRLIKLHHPDRLGGDSDLAAEINRAYRELRYLAPEIPPIQMRSATPPPAPRGKGVRLGRVLLGGVLVGAFLLLGDRSRLTAARLWPDSGQFSILADPGQNQGAPLVPFEDLSEPLAQAAIDGSVADAMRLHTYGDPAPVLQYSRACEAAFRNHPSIIWFDTCAAYDEAIVALDSRDPASDSGPFDAAEVTSREMSAARLLSDDVVAADSRLHEIRDRVDFVLISSVPAPEPAVAPGDAETANIEDTNHVSANMDAANVDGSN